jgi:nucleoside-diphosphate-sugar epimerase
MLQLSRPQGLRYTKTGQFWAPFKEIIHRRYRYAGSGVTPPKTARLLSLFKDISNLYLFDLSPSSLPTVLFFNVRSDNMASILISGAGGFIGQELAAALASDPNVGKIILTDIKEPPIPRDAISKEKFKCITIDLTSDMARDQLLELVGEDLDTVYLLHGIMSGAAEANLELGYAINLNATIAILRQVRRKPTTKVVYASVGAAYGPPASPDDVISETTAPNPQSSYGIQKVMVENLINDFSRRGLLDGRICRLPTVMPRAGAPTGAASSFASDIIREPLNGRRAVLPVSNKNLKMFVCSPSTIIKNLLRARELPKEAFAPYLNRVVNMPGVAITVQDILDAVVSVSPKGSEVLSLIEEQRDEATERIVASWPSNFDISRAFSLGFVKDPGLGVAVREYYERHIHVA